MMEVKIFDNGTMKECFEQCLKEGYKPASLKTLKKLINSKKIPNQWYDIATGYKNFTIFDLSLNQLNNLKEFFDSGGRVLCVGDYDYFGLGGNCDLNGNGRVAGVKQRERINKRTQRKILKKDD